MLFALFNFCTTKPLTELGCSFSCTPPTDKILFYQYFFSFSTELLLTTYHLIEAGKWLTITEQVQLKNKEGDK
jgi:hypothetical protein